MRRPRTGRIEDDADEDDEGDDKENEEEGEWCFLLMRKQLRSFQTETQCDNIERFDYCDLWLFIFYLCGAERGRPVSNIDHTS